MPKHRSLSASISAKGNKNNTITKSSNHLLFECSSMRGIHWCLGEQRIGITEDDQTKKGGGEDKNQGIGNKWILFGVLLGTALLVVSTMCFVLKLRRKRLSSQSKSEAIKDILSKKPSCLKASIKEVYTATNNLNESNFIGQGVAGKVYKGILSTNQQVAIKHIIDEENVDTVVREVTSLSHVKHPNLVSLLGCCVNEDECFLIYELCPNGNLSEWLFGKDKALCWIQRLEIAVGSARGLNFLHTYPEGCIVHRDIKPTNILLGPNFEAKLSDFGLSKVIESGQAQVSSEVRGTFGYLDPEYQDNHQVNSSGDVYSFGVVLLQILSGKKVVNLEEDKPMTLDKTAKGLIKGGNVTEFADPKLDGEYSVQAFDLTLQLALSCTTMKHRRPTMEQVLVGLQQALEISFRAKASSPELMSE